MIFCCNIYLDFIYPLKHLTIYMHKKLSILSSLFTALTASMMIIGCAPYRIPTQCLELNERGLDSPLYAAVPRHRCQIRPFDIGHWIMWSLFGNDDDGIFGEGPKAHYYPEQNPSLVKAIRWTVRNPFHNFCFYVIGSAYRENGKVTCVDLRSKLNGSRLFIGFHGGKPFISLCVRYSPERKGEFYFGWRERGNFGIKFLPFRREKRSFCFPPTE